MFVAAQIVAIKKINVLYQGLGICKMIYTSFTYFFCNLLVVVFHIILLKSYSLTSDILISNNLYLLLTLHCTIYTLSDAIVNLVVVFCLISSKSWKSRINLYKTREICLCLHIFKTANLHNYSRFTSSWCFCIFYSGKLVHNFNPLTFIFQNKYSSLITDGVGVNINGK